MNNTVFGKTFFRKFDINRSEKDTNKNEQVYLGISILDISQASMYEFCYYHIKM